MTTLEKMRTEIARKFFEHGFGNAKVCYEVLQIIDKYAEQEIDIAYIGEFCHKHGLVLMSKEMADKYADQEPCDDVVSRQAVINLVRGCNSALEEPRIFNSHNSGVVFEHYINELPSVRPQEQPGHWIRQDNTKEPLYGWYFCSECNSVIGEKTKFCSNCGFRMVEPQERSEQG